MIKDEIQDALARADHRDRQPRQGQMASPLGIGLADPGTVGYPHPAKRHIGDMQHRVEYRWARSPSRTWRAVPSNTHPSASRCAHTPPYTAVPDPVGSKRSIESGANWVIVARYGVGSIARPCSSNTMASSTALPGSFISVQP